MSISYAIFENKTTQIFKLYIFVIVLNKLEICNQLDMLKKMQQNIHMLQSYK